MPDYRYTNRQGIEMVVSTRKPTVPQKHQRLLAARPTGNPDYLTGSLEPARLQPSQKPAAPCELCGHTDQLTAHHLRPRHYGPDADGQNPVCHLCVPCHENLHSLWSNRVLADHFPTLTSLRAAFDWWSFGFLARGIAVFGAEAGLPLKPTNPTLTKPPPPE